MDTAPTPDPAAELAAHGWTVTTTPPAPARVVLTRPDHGAITVYAGTMPEALESARRTAATLIPAVTGGSVTPPGVSSESGV